ncbi:hypothetical protein MMYC01_202001 [Madurella mycetomatis]|uniref:Uncharacterized protein n=1 Tax=Madurella mycetomatis TaxID=100816 RepID=A0A175WGT6_9PEZI|nr:hypothetical protein MMYC01_202001 [Madurella mycetomatis]
MEPGYELPDQVEIDEESEEHVFAERPPTEAICVHISDELAFGKRKDDTIKSAIYILPKADITTKQETRAKVPLLTQKAAKVVSVGWKGIKAFTYAVGSFVDTVPYGHLRSKGRFH